jgi:hydroxyacylglutathione hydrolase
MILKYFYDETLAQASYLVGCAATGEALVVDPARNIQPFLDAAQNEGLQITHVTETHIHADFVSGTRELARATGATMFLSDEGDADWKYGWDENVVQLHDGDTWMVGNVKVEVIHTPGHTPEHLSFMITDTATTDKPMGVFTGDFLFVGDVGRPDLLDSAAGFQGTSEPGARRQFANVERFKTMSDHLQIWPAHGAGSACGKSLGAIPSSTLGYEKLVNPAFQFDDEDAFVVWLLDGQPEAPAYFARMKHVNKVGPAFLADAVTPQPMTRADLDRLLADDAQVIDARNQTDAAQAYVPGALIIPSDSNQFSTYAGWFMQYDQPIYLIAAEGDIKRIVRELQAIGYNNIPGYVPAADVHNGPTEPFAQVSASALSDWMTQNGMVVLDVRGASEYAEARIDGAVNMPLGYIPRHLDELDKTKPIVTQCQGGVRSQIAATLLRQRGFENVTNLEGGIDAWIAAGLPVQA